MLWKEVGGIGGRQARSMWDRSPLTKLLKSPEVGRILLEVNEL